MFLIYLKSQSETDSHGQNVYGFYTGKTYQKDFRTFPVCVDRYGDMASEGKLYRHGRGCPDLLGRGGTPVFFTKYELKPTLS